MPLTAAAVDCRRPHTSSPPRAVVIHSRAAVGVRIYHRPGGGLARYGSEHSAGIGLALLLPPAGGRREGGGETARSVAVFGHSMGARAALLTALRCAADPVHLPSPDLVVLVAPALEGVTLPPPRRRGSSPARAASVAVGGNLARSGGGDRPGRPERGRERLGGVEGGLC
jgi:pimeloyl-ACP methyl ester carboxylesterase